jgi:Uma2 family endonuclease
MATATTTPQEASIALEDLHRFSLVEYNRMGDLGALFPDQRVELLDGLLVKKMTKSPRHVSVTSRVIRLLSERLPAGWFPRREAPIALPGGPAGDSAPEPDVAVVAGTSDDDYEQGHPGPDDVALIVEVATNRDMLYRDRGGLGRYAWAGLPVVWIVNLAEETVEVSTGPSGRVPDPRYAGAEVKRRGSELSIAIGGTVVIVPVDEILR